MESIVFNRRKIRPFSVGEDIVNDFLETGCELGKFERFFLMKRLGLKTQMVESINIHSAFTINRRLICVLKTQPASECWLYYPAQLKLATYVLHPD